MNPLLYFWLFLKATLLSTGGQGNLPFLSADLQALGWAAPADFLTAIAVGNLSPGPTGLWSISLGYLTLGWLGSALALLALSIPPLLILVVDAFYGRIEKQRVVQHFSRGLGLAVVGLSVAVASSLARASITDWRGILIMAGAFLVALSGRLPVIAILLLAAAAGYVIYG